MSDTNEKQETIADIIAEKRREADFIVQSAEAYAKAGETLAGTPYDDCDLERERGRADEIRREADRLEAALKREKSAMEADALAVGGIVGATAGKASAVGNMAAMREALQKITGLFRDIDLTIDCPGNEAYAIAEQALAEPARNCDRFSGDYKMLHTAWSNWTASPSGRNPNNTMKMTFSEWLLAPAAEKKGGAE